MLHASDREREISFSITGKSPTLTDFFVLGQYLSLFTLLSRDHGISTRISFTTSGRIDALEQPMFFDFCKSRGIMCERPTTPGRQLMLLAEGLGRERRRYWHCLIPLTRIPFDQSRSEDEALHI